MKLDQPPPSPCLNIRRKLSTPLPFEDLLGSLAGKGYDHRRNLPNLVIPATSFILATVCTQVRRQPLPAVTGWNGFPVDSGPDLSMDPWYIHAFRTYVLGRRAPYTTELLSFVAGSSV